MAEPAYRRLSYQDYLALERRTDQRHEYLDGVVRAMAGGTVRHSALKSRLLGEVYRALGDRPCQPFDSDLKVHIEASGLFTYPDLTVVCGPLERSPADRHALTNPRVIFEVLSPGTEAYDRGQKFVHVQQAPSLTHYVLVSTTLQQIEVFQRTEQGWLYTRVDAGSLSLPDIGLEVELDRLYDGLPEDPAEEDETAGATSEAP